MNKLLIIFLAVCLINVHAFVKRDAEPAKTPNLLEDITKQLESLKTQMEQNLNPEHIKKEFNNVVDNITKFANSMKATSEAPK